jgi:hypothetical protein
MSKRIAVLVAVLALLLATAAFAEKPAPRMSHEAFLQSLELPAGGAVTAELPFAVSPLGKIQTKACAFQCKSCGVNKVKLCWAGTGCTAGCDACHNGTTCEF